MLKDQRAVQKLRRGAEKTECARNSIHQGCVEIGALSDGVDCSEAHLTRERFEEIDSDVFKNTLGPVKQVLEDSWLKEVRGAKCEGLDLEMRQAVGASHAVQEHMQWCARTLASPVACSPARSPASCALECLAVLMHAIQDGKIHSGGRSPRGPRVCVGMCAVADMSGSLGPFFPLRPPL
mmetsp:Transcript_44402/g.137529  ORF Transcript_44402/g.137529 Transcript_44402/m.137529 type:complete len:180 (-) Transcript_44402:409-948(-)